MAYLVSSHSNEPGLGLRLLQTAGQLAGAALLWPSRIMERRQLLRELTTMSDYELSDIGLTRSDLSDSTALPLGSEIGSFLSERAQGRRLSRRR